MSQRQEKIWKSDRKVVIDEKSRTIWKINQNSLMNEELVFNGVMNEELVQNDVMNAKIDLKVMMDLSIFKIGGWNSLQPINQELLIGFPSRDPLLAPQFLERHSVSSDQYMKKLMSLREGFHVMMQCHMQQHFADRYWLHEHPGGHASWRELTMRKFTNESLRGRTCVQMECSEDAIRIE